jgi:RNA polymerase sigma factor (sigma-70 family)
VSISYHAIDANAAGSSGQAWPFMRGTVEGVVQSSSRESDPVLVSACLNGDETAWQKLVERYGSLVYSIPRRLGLSAADADDVFQNVFLVAFRRLSSLRKHDSLSAWLIKITHRECLHFLRRTPDYAELAEEILDAAAAMPDEVELWEKRVLVREALNRLDPRSRALLQALFFEVVTPSYVEIAERLGVALGAVGPTRARSLRKLETILTSMGLELGSA